MARADSCSRIYSLLRLVFREVVGLALRLHLDSRNAAAHPDRSNHEFRLEIHAADVVYLRCRRSGLALCRARPSRLALVARRSGRRLLHTVDVARHAPEICAAHLPFRRMNSAAFILISIFTLAAALAAATLQKLMHAALSFAVAFVGVAAF